MSTSSCPRRNIVIIVRHHANSSHKLFISHILFDKELSGFASHLVLLFARTQTATMTFHDEQQEQQDFIDSLTSKITTYHNNYPRDVSIKLIESRDPEDFMQGIFTLELKCDKSDGYGKHECEHHSTILTEKGIRDPTCSWPVYKFLVDDSQSDFMWNKLLPAFQIATTATATTTPQLKTLTLQGLGRVPGFNTQLMKSIEDSQSLTSLSILNWADFITSVDSDAFASLPVLTRLEQFSVVYPDVDPTTKTARALGQALASMSQLRSLRLETGGEGVTTATSRALMARMGMNIISKTPLF